MRVTNFDRPICKAIRDDLVKALESVGKKYGVNITAGSGRYSPTNYTLKVEVATVSGLTGSANTKERVDFQKYEFVHGIPNTYLDKVFVYGGHNYVLVGYKPNSHKFPFLGRRDDGKVFKFTTSAVKRGLGLGG